MTKKEYIEDIKSRSENIIRSKNMMILLKYHLYNINQLYKLDKEDLKNMSYEYNRI